MTGVQPFALPIALRNAAAMFAAIAVPDGGGYFDAFTAIHVGSLLVAASAAAIVRPAFFTFAGATAPGGALGVASWPFGVAGFVFLGLLIVMMREAVRHQRRPTRSEERRVRKECVRAV